MGRTPGVPVGRGGHHKAYGDRLVVLVNFVIHNPEERNDRYQGRRIHVGGADCHARGNGDVFGVRARQRKNDVARWTLREAQTHIAGAVTLAPCARPVGEVNHLRVVRRDRQRVRGRRADAPAGDIRRPRVIRGIVRRAAVARPRVADVQPQTEFHRRALRLHSRIAQHGKGNLVGRSSLGNDDRQRVRVCVRSVGRMYRYAQASRIGRIDARGTTICLHAKTARHHSRSPVPRGRGPGKAQHQFGIRIALETRRGGFGGIDGNGVSVIVQHLQKKRFAQRVDAPFIVRVRLNAQRHFQITRALNDGVIRYRNAHRCRSASRRGGGSVIVFAVPVEFGVESLFARTHIGGENNTGGSGLGEFHREVHTAVGVVVAAATLGDFAFRQLPARGLDVVVVNENRMERVNARNAVGLRLRLRPARRQLHHRQINAVAGVYGNSKIYGFSVLKFNPLFRRIAYSVIHREDVHHYRIFVFVEDDFKRVGAGVGRAEFQNLRFAQTNRCPQAAARGGTRQHDLDLRCLAFAQARVVGLEPDRARREDCHIGDIIVDLPARIQTFRPTVLVRIAGIEPAVYGRHRETHNLRSAVIEIIHVERNGDVHAGNTLVHRHDCLLRGERAALVGGKVRVVEDNLRVVCRDQQTQAADLELIAAVRRAVGIKGVGRRCVVRERHGKRESRAVAEIKFGGAVGKADGLVRALNAQGRDELAGRPFIGHVRVRLAVCPDELKSDINLFISFGFVVVNDGNGEDCVFVGGCATGCQISLGDEIIGRTGDADIAAGAPVASIN